MMGGSWVRGRDGMGTGGVIEVGGALEVKMDGVRAVIKGEGVPEAGMDRGTHGMTEREEWTDGWGGGRRLREGGREGGRGDGGICEISTSKGQSRRGDRLPWRTNYGAKRVGWLIHDHIMPAACLINLTPPGPPWPQGPSLTWPCFRAGEARGSAAGAQGWRSWAVIILWHFEVNRSSLL